MIFKFKRHNTIFYNTLLELSRNIYFYKIIKLKDVFETRIYLIFFHFSIILLVYKNKKEHFPQSEYDNLFLNIENNLRELGFGDVAVNKKMKEINKIFYDILLKFNTGNEKLKINKALVFKYFTELYDKNVDKYNNFEEYFINFYNFCFEKDPKIVLKDALKFKI
jgi:cytochrome b pre-mRNA-processing protein 3